MTFVQWEQSPAIQHSDSCVSQIKLNIHRLQLKPGKMRDYRVYAVSILHKANSLFAFKMQISGVIKHQALHVFRVRQESIIILNSTELFKFICNSICFLCFSWQCVFLYIFVIFSRQICLFQSHRHWRPTADCNVEQK